MLSFVKSHTYLFIAFMIVLIQIVSSASSSDLQKSNNSLPPWKNRPRQFRMQVFSRPYSKGDAQTIRATNGASTPCWNLASKRVGSYELNDPLVKVTFFRSKDCQGAGSATFYNQNSLKQSHVLIKARSVSITKVKPIMLKNQKQ